MSIRIKEKARGAQKFSVRIPVIKEKWVGRMLEYGILVSLSEVNKFVKIN